MSDWAGSLPMRWATIRVTFDPHDREKIDADEWGYTIRVGGIDAEVVSLIDEGTVHPQHDYELPASLPDGLGCAVCGVVEREHE